MLHDGMSRIAFSDGWQRDLFDRAAAPCWARIGQFYAEVACREAGAVFLDQCAVDWEKLLCCWIRLLANYLPRKPYGKMMEVARSIRGVRASFHCR